MLEEKQKQIGVSSIAKKKTKESRGNSEKNANAQKAIHVIVDDLACLSFPNVWYILP